MGAAPVLAVDDLHVSFPTTAGVVRAVDGATWSVGAGETLGIVGESGSGKSVSALAVMGLVPPPGRVESGRITFGTEDLLRLGEKELRRLRGKQIAMVFQDPLTSLNPMFTVGAQIAEAIRAHERVDRAVARARAVDLLGEVRIPNPRQRAREYPHQISGGMRQRVMIAMALAGDPKVLLADEPTTALDVTVQARILDLLSELQSERGMAVVLITHDLAVVSGHADRVLVMYAGRLAELADADELFYRPRHPYTLGLLESVVRLDGARHRPLVPIRGQPPSLLRLPGGCAFHPRCRFATELCRSEVPHASTNGSEGHVFACFHSQVVEARVAPPGAVNGSARCERPEPPLLEVDGLTKHFWPLRAATFGRRRAPVLAVDGVSLRVFRGRTLALVGESGSGKTTTARTILRLVEPTSGSVRFAGEELTTAGAARLRQLRRQMQLVFQDPYASLNPRMSVGRILREPFTIHGLDAAPEDVHALLAAVGLPAEHAGRFPHELSGGERQRVGIARAIALQPRLVVCDEPVSALDASIQAQVLNLLQDLQRERGLAYLFIAHDLRVVRHIADRVAVMYAGRIIETAPADDLFDRPAHPYTRTLLSAVPVPDPREERARRRIAVDGEGADSRRPMDGCPFRMRCPTFATGLNEGDRQRCVNEVPQLVGGETGQAVACHYPARAPVG